MRAVRLRWWIAVGICSLLGWQADVISSEQNPDEPRVRSFELDYGATIVRLRPGAEVNVWVPIPGNSPVQTVRELQHDFPAVTETGIDPTYGNRIRYFHCQAPASGELKFAQHFSVEREELLGKQGTARETAGSPTGLEPFLRANLRVPVTGKPLELLTGIELPAERLRKARTLYDVVDAHVAYDKSQPGYGNGDTNWVCDSRTGNCTDFHSLFISLARSQGIPGRFEIGFPLPAQRGQGVISGYHCWAHFFVEGSGWVPVDISEADKYPSLKEYYFGNLTENRVAFSTGRDIILVPPQQGPPLNYFVYPYVEVDGKRWPADLIRLAVQYRDLEGPVTTSP